MLEPKTATPEAEIEAQAYDDTPAPTAQRLASEPEATLVEADLLVEDVSIDGMCGVY